MHVSHVILFIIVQFHRKRLHIPIEIGTIILKYSNTSFRNRNRVCTRPEIQCNVVMILFFQLDLREL